MMQNIKNKIIFKNWRFITRKHSTATESSLSLSDMPQPKALPVIGTKLHFLFTGSPTRLHEYIDQRHKQLGSTFHESLGSSTELVFTSDPDLMKSLFLRLEGKTPAHILPEPWLLYEKLYGSKRGLLFMDGEEWLHSRRIVNKHLLRENADKWLEIPIKETIRQFMLNWTQRTDKNSFVPNLESELYRLSTNVIINVLLGTNPIGKTSHFEELLSMFSESVRNIFQTTNSLYGLPATVFQKLNLNRWKKFKESVDFSLSLAHKIVIEMIHTRQENDGLVKKLIDENMDEEMITRIGADFVIAAGDTTAYTVLWTLFLLSSNSTVKEEIRNAKDTSYVKNVLKESMRLYPVAPFLTRILPKEAFFGKYILCAGTPIIASIYTSGRDEKNFSRADEFLPYRWDKNDPRKQELKNHVPSASLPFAHGSRSCIGKKIAMLQLSETISQIVNNFDFKCINDTEIKPVTSMILIPNQEIQLQMSARKESSNKLI